MNRNNNRQRANGRTGRRRGTQGRRQLVRTTTKSTTTMRNDTELEALRQMPYIHRMPRMMYTPEAVLVDLTFPDTSYTRNNVASTFLSWRYRANSIYDPDPALGSGSVPGYSYYSGGYNAYLVVGIGYDISLANMESSAVDAVVWPTVTDVGLNYSAVNEMFGNPYASQGTMSAKGGMDRVRLKGFIDLGHFYGNMSQYVSAFGSLFGANPASIYLNIGGVSPAAFTVNNGLDVRVVLTYRVIIFSRKHVIS